MSEITKKHKGLGRGLNALFEEDEDMGVPVSGGAEETPSGHKRQSVGVEQLHPSPFQPRHSFDEQSIAELADSIKRHGLIQPIVVRADKDQPGTYEIIAGERRWRAAQKAQLHEVAVIIADFDDIQALEIALIENLQREDLNPIDEANGYHKLLEDYGHTQQQLAEALGKSRSHIANMVRLLGLPDGVQGYLKDGKLSTGHARALITAKDPESLAKQVITQNLNVRETEALAMEDSPKSKKPAGKAKSSGKDTDTIALEREMTNLLGMRVSIDAQGQKGQVRINFRDLDQLDEILKRLSNNGAGDSKPASGHRLND